MEVDIKNNEFRRVAPSAKIVWSIHAIIRSLFLVGISVAVYLLIYKHFWIFIPVALLTIFWILIEPAIEYHQWRYFIGEDRIEIIYGIFLTKHSLIPINRIQHLKIKQGILQKRFGLASVDIYTAGGSHEIQAVLYEEADNIIRSLNRSVLENSGQKAKPESEEAENIEV